MKILWVMNSPIGIAARALTNASSQSGTWIDATLDALNDGNYNISIAAYNTIRNKVIVNRNLTIYGMGEYCKIGKNKELGYIAKVLDEIRPDLIQIWGTEYPFGICVIKYAKQRNIPVVFYIQGVMSAISQYPFGGLSIYDLVLHAGPIGMLKGVKLVCSKRGFSKQAQYEKQMIEESDGYICDNDWVRSYFCWYCEKGYHHITPVNSVFLNTKWKYRDTNEKVIMTIGGTNAGKGQHKLLEAICFIKRYFPNIKVVIPGEMHFGWKENPYVSYLKWYIAKNGLNDNVEFCGQLNSEQMVERLLRADVFVNPSYIENISTSLREAMYLGLPCVTSQVGSLHEIIHHGYNCLSYRYKEANVLAHEILQILNDKGLAIRLGDNAYYSIREKYPQDDVGNNLSEIYKEIVQSCE